MSPEAQRIAVAEARGWNFEKKPRHNMLSEVPAWHVLSPEGILRCGKEIQYATRFGKESRYWAFEGDLKDYLDECKAPNYPTDLNAMHEVFLALDPWLQPEFTANLLEVYRSRNPARHGAAAVDMLCAPASDWCEALLKTIGKWEVVP